MNGNGKLRTRIPDVAGSVSDLTNDVIELTELQAKLLVLDLKRSSRRTRMCLISAVIGVCFLLGTIPVALYALAELLVAQLQWSQAAALGAAALVGLVLAAIGGGIAWGLVKGGLVSLERSREEFGRNVDWLKSTLRNRGQPFPEASGRR